MKPVVEIDFETNDGTGSWVPAGAIPPELSHRLAVIQHTYVPDLVDMYFDEALWLSLLDFVTRFEPGAEISVIDNWHPSRAPEASEVDGGHGMAGRSFLARVGEVVFGKPVEPARSNVETGLSAYVQARLVTPPEDRRPPGLIKARTDQRTVLWMVTEYWSRIGGPDRYHDSYTYSLFSDRDLEDEVRLFLQARPDASRWRMEPVAD